MSQPERTVGPAELHILTTEAAKRANADPLPGPAGDAFAKFGPIQVGPHFVRPVVAYDWKVLRQVKSPVIDMLMELRQNPTSPASVDMTDEQEYMLVFQFTRSPQEVRKAISQGIEKYTEIVMSEIADKIDEPMIRLIEISIIEQIRRSWITAIAYREELEQKEEVNFFPDSAPTNPKTA